MSASENVSHSGHAAEISTVPSYDDINTPIVVMVGVISALLTLLAMMFVQGLYYHWEDRIISRPAPARMMEEDPVVAQQRDLNEGRVTIEEAMQRVVAKFNQ